MKTKIVNSILFVFFSLVIGNSSVYAGCTGVCISSDSAGANTIDTIYNTTGNVTLYARYNGACQLIGFDTLVWFRDGIAVDTTTSADAVFDGVWNYTTAISFSQPGIYTVFPIQFIGPSYQCGEITVLNSTGTSTYNPENSFSGEELIVFPNPSINGSITVVFPPTILSGNLFVNDLTGRTVYAVEKNDNEKTELQLGNLPGGYYTLEFISAQGNFYRKKFSISK